jgi:hypothetical protein
MNKRLEPNAPRFHTLWEHREGRRIFIMRKDDWDSLDIRKGTPVLLDFEENDIFAFGSISNQPDFLAAIASRTDEEVSIAIYRKDPKDDPYLVNLDRYTVWESFPPQIYVQRNEMIQTADTNADDNFMHYEEDHVFMVKEDASEDHWLRELPSTVIALFQDVD